MFTKSKWTIQAKTEAKLTLFNKSIVLIIQLKKQVYHK